jgi:hypothetical protein
VVRWLTTTTVVLDTIDAEDPTITDMHYLPHTEKLAEQLRTCLQEGEDIPRDVTQLFDHALYNMDTSLVPDALEVYVSPLLYCLFIACQKHRVLFCPIHTASHEADGSLHHFRIGMITSRWSTSR